MPKKNKKQKPTVNSDDVKVFLSFWEKARNGEYAEIEKSALDYTRVPFETSLAEPSEYQTFYGIS